MTAVAIDRPWEEYPYKVFVSYSHDDQLPDRSGKSWGVWLEEALEAYEVPAELVGRWSRFGTVPARIQPVFRDRSGFSAAPDVRAAIRTALDDSATMIVVCGPSAAKSVYVNDEVAYFKSKGRTGQIFALICDGEPNSGDARECFPAALTHRVNADGEILKTAEEPLAADARPGKDEPDLALLKIIAALLRVPLASLREKTNSILEARLKEQQAQTARLQALAADLRGALRRSSNLVRGAVALAIVAAIGFGIAFWQGLVASAQRDEGLITQSRYLAEKAIQTMEGCPGALDCDPGTAALIALEAAPGRIDRPETLEAAATLQRAVFASVRDKGTFAGHTNTVRFAEFSPDRRLIVTASDDATAKIWDADTGQMRASLNGHTNRVVSAQFSPDGQSIVTASADSTAKLWDTATGQARATLKGHTNTIWNARFSPDGKTVLSASSDNTAKVWDAQTGTERTTLKGHTDRVWSAQFSADGQSILTTSRDGTVKLWDAATGTERASLKEQMDAGVDPLSPEDVSDQAGIVSAGFSPDGLSVVTASRDSKVTLWDVKSGTKRASLAGHRGIVHSVRFSPDGSTIVTAAGDSTARLWDAKTGSERASLKGHIGEVLSATFSPDGKSIVTASDDGTAKLWDAATGAERASLKGHKNGILNAQFSSDGHSIVTASSDATAKIWDAQTGTESVTCEGHDGAIFSAQFSLDGTRIITASQDSTTKVWDAQTCSERATRNVHTDTVNSAWFSPDGQTILSASSDNSAKVWDAATGQVRLTLSGHKDRVRSAQYSPDGNAIVTASDDATAIIWDAVTGQKRATLRGHSNTVWNAQFSPDGQSVVTASWDNTARIWDANTGQQSSISLKHNSAVWSAQFSADGLSVVTASGDRTARLWDAETGQMRGSLMGHTAAVLSAQFSPDGLTIATASDDNTAKLWDAKTRTESATLRGHSRAVRSAQFSPDGLRLVTSSEDGTAKVWNVAMYRSLPAAAYTPLAELSVQQRLNDAKRVSLYLDAMPAAAGRPAAANDCDRLAADPQDPDRYGAGTGYNKIVAAKAIAACTNAIRAEPETARFYVQLSRAQQKARAWDKAYTAAQEAARRDSAMGYLRIAQIHREPKSRRYDFKAAIKAYREAFTRGLDIAGLDLAQLYRDGVTNEAGAVMLEPDLSQAVAVWRDLIARGNATAHARLADAAERKLNPTILSLSLDDVLYHYGMAAELAYQKGEPENRFAMARRAMLARYFWREGKEQALIAIWDRVKSDTSPAPFYVRWLKW